MCRGLPVVNGHRTGQLIGFVACCREQLQATRSSLADGSGPEAMLVKSGDPVTFEAISRRGAKVGMAAMTRAWLRICCFCCLSFVDDAGLLCQVVPCPSLMAPWLVTIGIYVPAACCLVAG